ncbi:formate/nitrite transporter family protein [Clostridium algoriphilum]|nr:formate/nitrite transporter family protein [Clostridium algoriphilum]MCB2293111.1 formate/nitrite transporter family protein [Clostridium algoriphilum]
MGSIVLALMFVGAGLAKGSTATFILKASQVKLAAPSMELFFKGLLCNMLVCLAVWKYMIHITIKLLKISRATLYRHIKDMKYKKVVKLTNFSYINGYNNLYKLYTNFCLT